jgi:predicted XRE-type DNA-binding protein
VSRKKRKSIEFEEGSGSVFADLGLKDSDQLLARAQIGFHVFNILENKKLKQREIAEVLGHCSARRVAPDEWAFPPLHDGQAA